MNSLALIIAQVNLKKLFIFTFPLFLVLGSLALFLVSPQSEIFNTEEYSLISNIVFFNQAHILLTFFLIFSVDHFKFWRKTSKVMGMPVDVHMAIAFMVFFFVVLTFFYDGFAMGRPKSIYLYFYLYQIIGLHHFLYQSFGFSSHLSRRKKTSIQQKRIP